jgi:helicase associated protein
MHGPKDNARPCLPAPRPDVARSEPLTRSVQQGLAALWEYTKEHGVARPPWRFQTVSGFWLGAWVMRRRRLRGEDLQLDLLLESLPGWTWASAIDSAFAEKLERVTQLIADERPIRDAELRTWVRTQRRAAKRGKMSEERLARLQAVGIFDLHMHEHRVQRMCKTGAQR